MPYQVLPDAAANDALGPGTLNGQRSNLIYNRQLAGAEHLVSGEHNAREVARVCRRITSAPAVSPSSTDITAVTNPSTGRYVLTLAADRFDTDIRIQVNPLIETSKPYIATWQFNSATEIEVFIKRLSSTLGVAGNSWTARDSGFDIAIHGMKLAQTSQNTLPAQWQRAMASEGYGLVGGGDNTTPVHWSAAVREQAVQYAQLTAAHTSAGVHNVREVAKSAGKVYWNGSEYKCDSTSWTFSGGGGGGGGSVGVLIITHDSYTTPISAFTAADFSRYNGGTDVPTIVNATNASATTTEVKIYQWNSGGGYWELANGDFWISIHGDA